MNRLLVAITFCCFTITIFAQNEITITGRVSDADTKEGIPFANVIVKGSDFGVATDIDGYYELSINGKFDSIYVSAIGFQGVSKPISPEKVQVINFALNESDFTLSEVVVYAGENPANAIVRGIIKNKDQNRIEAIDSYQYESYAKVELDLENISPKIQNNKFLKPFKFVFENIDSTSDEKPFLPTYISESVTDVYYVKAEGSPKKVIRAQKTSGIDNESFIEFIKNIHDEFSIYDNWINIVEKPFISPFANAALSYYEFYIIDSTFFNGKWSYQLKFKPKRKQEPTFYGDFWVADTSFAIQRINMRMSQDVNINLVKRIIIYQEFEPEQSFWLPVKQKMVVDFIPAKGGPGLIGRRTETFKKYKVNNIDVDEFYKGEDSRYYLTEELVRDENYWENARHEPLSSTEKTIYKMVDSLVNMPLYQTYLQIFETALVGYFKIGKIEIGPYFSVYGRNPVEQNRLRMGIRTNPDFSKNFQMGGYAAYGTRDKELKYGFNVDWLINKRPRVIVGAGYKNDISLNSESSEDFLESDLFSGSLRRNIVQKLIRVEEAKIYAERYWKNSLSNRFTLLHRYMDPLGSIFEDGGGFNYAFQNGNNPSSDIDTTISTTEIIFKTRFAAGEEFIDRKLERTSIGTDKPIIELTYTLGINGFLNGDYTYHKLSLYYRHYFNLNPAGWLAYRFKAGKAFGRLPFLLLEVHPGNEGYFMTRGIFNTMNRYEFASDTYLSAVFEHHFDGFFLNRIPLLRKLKWREVATFKAVVGSITKENLEANRLSAYKPTDSNNYSGFRTPDQGPYMEAGVGIENILKVIRIDALWRLNYLDNPQAPPFTLILGLYFYF